jgi:hypothetical protein
MFADVASGETALRLGRYFTNDPQFWVDLQARYDLAVGHGRCRPDCCARGRDGGVIDPTSVAAEFVRRSI